MTPDFLAKADRFFSWANEQEQQFRRDYQREPKNSLVERINEAFRDNDHRRVERLMLQAGWQDAKRS